jgi:hypothetical protein
MSQKELNELAKKIQACCSAPSCSVDKLLNMKDQAIDLGVAVYTRTSDPRIRDKTDMLNKMLTFADKCVARKLARQQKQREVAIGWVWKTLVGLGLLALLAITAFLVTRYVAARRQQDEEDPNSNDE